MTANRLVHIVDDDAPVRDALVWLLKSHGIESVAWESGSAFMGGMPPRGIGCLVLDIRMPEMSGIELFDQLRKSGVMFPVIFLTGHGDVPMAVQAIKDGAFDFLEKPVDDIAFLDRIHAAMTSSADQAAAENRRIDVDRGLEQLTTREREVMDLVLAGKLNKIIADDLGIAMRTVEVHRARIFEKMGVRSAVELSQLLSGRR